MSEQDKENTSWTNKGGTNPSFSSLDQAKIASRLQTQNEDLLVLKTTVEGVKQDISEIKGRLERVSDRLDKVTDELRESTINFTAQTNKIVHSLSDALIQSRKIEAEQASRCGELNMQQAKIDAENKAGQNTAAVSIVKEVVKIALAILAGIFGGAVLGGGQ